MIQVENGLNKSDPSAFKRNSDESGGPSLTSGEGESPRQRSGRHNFACSKRRTELIFRQRLGEVAQRKQRPAEDVGAAP